MTGTITGIGLRPQACPTAIGALSRSDAISPYVRVSPAGIAVIARMTRPVKSSGNSISRSNVPARRPRTPAPVRGSFPGPRRSATRRSPADARIPERASSIDVRRASTSLSPTDDFGDGEAEGFARCRAKTHVMTGDDPLEESESGEPTSGEPLTDGGERSPGSRSRRSSAPTAEPQVRMTSRWTPGDPRASPTTGSCSRSSASRSSMNCSSRCRIRTT